jgi:hypothetical protein
MPNWWNSARCWLRGHRWEPFDDGDEMKAWKCRVCEDVLLEREHLERAHDPYGPDHDRPVIPHVDL